MQMVHTCRCHNATKHRQRTTNCASFFLFVLALDVRLVGVSGRATDSVRDAQGSSMAADTATLDARPSQLTTIRQHQDFCVLQGASSEADTQFATIVLPAYYPAECESGTTSLEAGNRIEKRASTIDSDKGCEVHTSFAAWVQRWGSRPGSGSWE